MIDHLWRSFAYNENIYYRIAMKIEDAVSKEVSKMITDDKKISKREKDERYWTGFFYTRFLLALHFQLI